MGSVWEFCTRVGWVLEGCELGTQDSGPSVTFCFEDSVLLQSQHHNKCLIKQAKLTQNMCNQIAVR